MSRRNPHFANKGLTLIEMMVALGVLVILVGGIFFVVQTSLSTVIAVDKKASREDELTNIIDILRHGFRNMPSRARMVAQPAPMSNGNTQYVLAVRNAPGFLTWLAQVDSSDVIVLLSMRQDDENSGWRICVKRFNPPQGLGEEDFNVKNLLQAGSKIPWLELVGDFKTSGMRFFDSRKKAWRSDWVDSKIRPALVEFTLDSEFLKDAMSEHPVIWIPPVFIQGAAR